MIARIRALVSATGRLMPPGPGRTLVVRLLALIAAMSLSQSPSGSLPAARAEVTTTTVLPTRSENLPAGQSTLLKIQADGRNTPLSRGRLILDLGPIPPGVTIKSATLQLVASEGGGDQVQEVQVFADGGSDPVGRWTSRKDRCCIFATSTERLRQVVAKAFADNKPLSLMIQSISTNSDWTYYSTNSTAEFKDISANRPRLIVEYELPPALAARQRERDTARTGWKFFPRPVQATVSPALAQVKGMISNPVFYRGGIYVFAQSQGKPMLYALTSSGANLWGPKEITSTPGEYALVSVTGRLYSVGAKRIAVYDLERAGEEITQVSGERFTFAGTPTLAADGSMFAMPSGFGYIYGLNPVLQELWRYPSDGKTKVAAASPVALSPQAGRYAYLLTRTDKETRPVQIDTATGAADIADLKVKVTNGGAQTERDLDLQFTSFLRPLVVKNNEADMVFLSANTVSNGMLVARSGKDVVWFNEGLVAQRPIADREEQHVVAVHKRAFRLFDKSNGTKATCSSSDDKLTATSNLVMDGDGNTYFWNSGSLSLLGYTKACQKFLSQQLKELPENVDLMFAPDGTLYAWSATDKRLYTITLGSPAVTLDMATNRPQTDRIYSAETIQVAPNVRIDNENIVLKAQRTISFANGVSVGRGAQLRCRLGP